MKSRKLALDVGQRRIGVAVSDLLGLTAQALTVIDNTTATAVQEQIKALVVEHDVDTIVVGLPRRTDGTYGPEAQRVRAFGRQLQQATGVDVVYWDERFSTAVAERTLIAGGARRKQRRQVIDKVAATVILQAYLDSLSYKNDSNEEWS